MAVQESSYLVSNSNISKLGEAIVAGVKFAARLQLVQIILKLADRLLGIVEKSMQWSLPIQEITTEENGKAFDKMELVRPLPWILFLPSLIILRAIRAGLNVGAFVLGYPAVQPSEMVRFIQNSRKCLRTIKLNGLRVIRERKIMAKDRQSTEAKNSLIRSILLTLSTLSCLDSSTRTPSPPPMKIRVHNNLDTSPTPEEQSTTESMTSPVQNLNPERNYSEVSDDDQSSENSQDEAVWSKIERLTMDKSIEDQDFNPAECALNDDTISSSDPEEDISLGELRDLMEDSASTYSLGNVYKEVIKEEIEVFNDDAGQQQNVNKGVTNSEGKSLQPKQTERVGNEKEFLSPVPSNTDLEVDFYSPISSKSPSPERYPITSSESDSTLSFY